MMLYTFIHALAFLVVVSAQFIEDASTTPSQTQFILSESESSSLDIDAFPSTFFITTQSSSSSSTSTSSEAASRTNAAPPLPSDGSSSGSPSSPGSAGSGFPTGFTVGTAVGGSIGGIAIITLLVFWFRAHKKKKLRLQARRNFAASEKTPINGLNGNTEVTSHS